MTTIAFDGRFLAADRRMTQGNEITARACRKLDVAGSPAVAFASTGLIIDGWRTALIDWWMAGHAPDEMPGHGTADDPGAIGNFIAVEASGAVWVASYHRGRYPWRDEAPCAWGTGADYATGAMLADKTAMEAVAIAARRDIYTGGGVQFIDLRDLAVGVRDWTAAASVPIRCKQRRRAA